jgi:beta-galactosidase
MSQNITRRSFVGSAAAFAMLPKLASAAPAAVPPSPRQRLDFNLDWLFVREDVPGAEAPGFDDSKWAEIVTPHSFNDVDSFRTIISHGGGDRGTYKGLSWYRKHFTPPKLPAGGKLFLEFEGMRQAGDIYLNGKEIGLYENGVTPYGIDITGSILPGKPNVLAVKVDNRTNYAERATGTTFQWNANDFNPDHGGINRRVWLHVTGPIFQTLPLYYGLETQGV